MLNKLTKLSIDPVIEKDVIAMRKSLPLSSELFLRSAAVASVLIEYAKMQHENGKKLSELRTEIMEAGEKIMKLNMLPTSFQDELAQLFVEAFRGQSTFSERAFRTFCSCSAAEKSMKSFADKNMAVCMNRFVSKMAEESLEQKVLDQHADCESVRRLVCAYRIYFDDAISYISKADAIPAEVLRKLIVE